MHITEEEINKYFELKNNFENNGLKLTDQDLILVNKVNNHVRFCSECMNKYNDKNNEKQSQKDEMETLTEEYGIDFKNIKHIRLQNGKEYYKLYDMRLNKDYLLEKENKSKNLSEEFKEIQESIKETQKYSGETNASEVFRYQLMHTNNGKTLYTINEIEKLDTKKYVKTKRNLFNQTGFTNTILLSLLTGFAGGVITTIIYMIIK